MNKCSVFINPRLGDGSGTLGRYLARALIFGLQPSFCVAKTESRYRCTGISGRAVQTGLGFLARRLRSSKLAILLQRLQTTGSLSDADIQAGQGCLDDARRGGLTARRAVSGDGSKASRASFSGAGLSPGSRRCRLLANYVLIRLGLTTETTAPAWCSAKARCS